MSKVKVPDLSWSAFLIFRAALGPIDPAIDLESLGTLFRGTFDKSLFSMLIPEVKESLTTNVVIFGIEVRVTFLGLHPTLTFGLWPVPYLRPPNCSRPRRAKNLQGSRRRRWCFFLQCL